MALCSFLLLLHGGLGHLSGVLVSFNSTSFKAFILHSVTPECSFKGACPTPDSSFSLVQRFQTAVQPNCCAGRIGYRPSHPLTVIGHSDDSLRPAIRCKFRPATDSKDGSPPRMSKRLSSFWTYRQSVVPCGPRDRRRT